MNRDVAIVTVRNSSTRLPNKVPEDIESPIIIVIPDIANTIDKKPIKETFSLR